MVKRLLLSFGILLLMGQYFISPVPDKIQFLFFTACCFVFNRNPIFVYECQEHFIDFIICKINNSMLL